MKAVSKIMAFVVIFNCEEEKVTRKITRIREFRWKHESFLWLLGEFLFYILKKLKIRYLLDEGGLKCMLKTFHDPIY